jgi:hypothetical protein
MIPRFKILSLAAVASLALSGCMASRYQISDALMRYGLDRNQADCAAEFLRGHLSTRQVDRLADAARYYRSDSRLTFGDLIRVAASVRDTRTTLEVGAAAVACKLGANMRVPGF